MKKIYLILAAAVGMTITSCTTNDFLGDVDPNAQAINDGAIRFGLGVKGATRADIGGKAAADLLGNNFYVMGTKGTEQATSPTTIVVFDNYLVNYGINTAGTTQSNTANWEYVGIDQSNTVDPAHTPDIADHVKLSSTTGPQTIKFWDYSAAQYDFFAFSTGTYKAVATTSGNADEIGVTAMNSGSTLANSGTAFQFDLPSVTALTNTYFTDITEVFSDNYGKDVTLQFKSLATKVRVALYETVPGYSVKNVEFYTDETTAITTDISLNTNAILISSDGIPTKGQITVFYPHVGSNNDSEADYNKAAVTVTPGSSPQTAQSFGALTSQLVTKERAENMTNVAVPEFLGRTLPTATFAGSADESFYTPVFPVSTPAPLTLRVNYTLVPIDGAAETITVKGAKAVVPSTYTKWLPNYAYTYIFKISDNTNGWTGAADKPAGLFPITFDAVVAEKTDANADQTTITTVATPTITTYQQGHNSKTDGDFDVADEYSKTTDKDIYVQVMDNEMASPVLVGTGSSTKPKLNSTSPYTASLLYAVTSGKVYAAKPAGWPKGYYTDVLCTTEASGTFSTSTTYYKRCTEADVMDALENQASVDASDNITGRNGVLLTKNTNISASVDEIVNGVDDNPIDLKEGGVTGSGYGKAAMIDISALATGTYAYVYDYSSTKTETKIYRTITMEGTDVIPSTTKYVTQAILDGVSAETAANEAVDKEYIYFTKTTNGTGTTTYSFVNVDGKTNLPAGLLKVKIDGTTPDALSGDGSKTVTEAGALFIFDSYTRNNGKYAVKVIKVVA